MQISHFALALVFVSVTTTSSFCGEARPALTAEWEKTIEAAKKEGTLVAAIPASAELRKAIGEIFPKRFLGIELEVTTLPHLACRVPL